MLDQERPIGKNFPVLVVVGTRRVIDERKREITILYTTPFNRAQCQTIIEGQHLTFEFLFQVIDDDRCCLPVCVVVIPDSIKRAIVLSLIHALGFIKNFVLPNLRIYT